MSEELRRRAAIEELKLAIRNGQVDQLAFVEYIEALQLTDDEIKEIENQT